MYPAMIITFAIVGEDQDCGFQVHIHCLIHLTALFIPFLVMNKTLSRVKAIQTTWEGVPPNEFPFVYIAVKKLFLDKEAVRSLIEFFDILLELDYISYETFQAIKETLGLNPHEKVEIDDMPTLH